MAELEPTSQTLIYILDDDPDAGAVMADALRRHTDAAVRAFKRLEEMLAAEGLVRVDLFVLDIQLENGLSGFDVPACLPTRCRFAAFLFVSGYPVESKQFEHAAGLSYFDFIAKPFAAVHFVHRVNLLLAARLKMPGDMDDRILDLWAVTPFVAVVLDEGFNIRLCNRQMATLLEIGSARELVGRSWSDFLPDETVATGRDIHQTVLAGDLAEVGEITTTVKTVSGVLHRVKWFNCPFEGVDGEALTLSVGVPGEYKRRMAHRLRETWRESILKHRAAIQAIRRMPLRTEFPDICALDEGER